MKAYWDSISAYDAAGGGSIVAAPATLPMDSVHRPHSSTFELVNGEVIVRRTAAYEVQFDATLAITTGTSRSHGEAWLEVNGVEVPGTRICLYCRMASHGATGTARVELDLQEDDVVRIRVERTIGGATLVRRADGSRLKMRRF